MSHIMNEDNYLKQQESKWDLHAVCYACRHKLCFLCQIIDLYLGHAVLIIILS